MTEPPAVPEPSFRHQVLAALAARPQPGAPGEDLRLQTVCLLGLTVLACMAAAWWLRDVLVPFVFAVFLTFVLQPLIDVLTRRLRLPHGVSTAITLAVGVLILVGLAAVVTASVMQLTQGGEDYQARLGALLERIGSTLALKRFGLDPHKILNSLATTAADSLGQVLGGLFNALFSLVSHGVVVVIYLFFLLFGSAQQERQEGVWGEIRSSIEYYLLVKTVLSFAIGALTWLILDLLDVKLALAFGLLAFAFNYIPNVGPIVATLLPLPVVFLTPDVSLATAAMAILLPAMVHLLIGYLVEPRIMGTSLELDPVVVLLALMLASVVWGPVGMLLATPMAAVARILLERGSLTRPVAHLMAGRLASEPSSGREPRDEAAG